MLADLDLPYNLPCTTRGKVDYLANLMGVRQRIHLRALPPEVAVELLTLIALYRHLDRLGKRRVETLLQRVDRRVLNDLQSAMAVPSVQPSWGMWSLTTNELLQRKRTLSTFNRIAGALGLTASITGANDLYKFGRQSARGAAGSVALLMIVGFVGLQQLEEGNIDAEMIRRLQPSEC